MATTLTSTAISGLQLKAGTVVATPAAGYGRLWYKAADKTLHLVNDAGVDIDLSASTSGAIGITSQAALDFIYAASATQLARLAKGTAYQVPRMNAAANAWEFATLGPQMGGVSIATVALSDGATPALNAALGSVFRLAAAGNRTIAVPSNPTSGQKIVIQHYASGGARTLALNTGAGGFRYGATVTALTATTSGKTDYVGCIYNATDSFWDVVAVAKGY